MAERPCPLRGTPVVTSDRRKECLKFKLSYWGGVNARYLSEVSQEVLAALNFLKKRTGAYLVDSGETSTTWYRKYSDGWVEQGGNVASVGYNKPASVTYPVAFGDSNFSLCVGNKANNTEINYSIMSVKSCTQTGCVVHNGSSATGPMTWFACGYS